MKAKQRIEYFLCAEDYRRIKVAIKAEKRTIKSVYEELGMTKDEFYAQVRGKKPVQLELYRFIFELNVELVFEGMC